MHVFGTSARPLNALAFAMIGILLVRPIHAETISDQQLADLVKAVNSDDENISIPAGEKLIDNGDELWPRLYKQWTETHEYIWAKDAKVFKALWLIREDPSLAAELMNLLAPQKWPAGYQSRTSAYKHLAIMDTPTGRRQMIPYVRVRWLLAPRLSQRMESLDVLDYSIESTGKENERAILNEEESAYLKRHADALRERMLADLEGHGDTRATIMLASIGERNAIPQLRELFVTSTVYDDWKLNPLDPFQKDQYRAKYAYECAIEHLTGKTLEEAISLTPDEINFLKQRNKRWDRYVLLRLAPKEGRAFVFKRYLDRPKAYRATTAIEVADVLQEGMTRRKIVRALGPPDRRCEVSEPLRNLPDIPAATHIEIYNVGKLYPYGDHYLALSYRDGKLERSLVYPSHMKDCAAAIEALYECSAGSHAYAPNPSVVALLTALSAGASGTNLFAMSLITYDYVQTAPGNSPKIRSAVKAFHSYSNGSGLGQSARRILSYYD